jgi:hypothetical protein
LQEQAQRDNAKIFQSRDFLMFTFAYAQSTPTPATVEASIRSIGAEATVRELWRRPKEWDAVLNGVTSGDQNWLRVATELKVGADAGQSEDLAIVVSRSIQHNASAFLLVAFPSFGVSVCRDLTIEPTAEQHNFFKRKTREALNAVDNKAMRQSRDACLAELQK